MLFWKERTRAQLMSTAIHEAGHAVIGRRLGLGGGAATIAPDHVDDTFGHTIVAYELAEGRRWRSEAAVRRARIIACMAGGEAERILLGVEPNGDGRDRKEIEFMAEFLSGVDWEPLELRLRRMARMLVRRHQVRIARTASVLRALRTVDARALDALARMPNRRLITR
jgi:hypothetical protein